MIRALLLDGFGTVLDWSGPFEAMNESAYRRAYGSVDGMAPRMPPFSEWFAHYAALRDADRAARESTHAEPDYARRFQSAFERAGLAKRQARVLGEKARERYFAEVGAQIRLAPDAGAEFWRSLPEGLLLGLVSNYGDGATMQKALDRLGIFYRFDVVVVSGEIGFLKPHPRPFQHALSELDVLPADALFVGDDLARDAMAARALGLHAALVANPREGLRDPAADPAIAVPADVARIGGLAEIPALLAKLA